ncbi:MAG TPA: RHS repeat-associated core domain-containing protein [Gemmatimonadaceae bacterium]|jgi:RHS repeat-associated protein|nr:RHS repeat-associated core domain-containing protein [Gemmatimonadaceae bacterium]
MLHARLRMCALRWSALLAVLLYAPLLAAQAPIEDVTPPTITMLLTGSYTTASIVVDIQFSDYSFDPSSMVETVNGVAVTSAFSFALGPLCPPHTTCLRTATSSGMIHLVPGSNTFHVELCDGDANCGAKDAHYTYTPPPPPQLLSVTPTYESVEAERSKSYVQTFTIYNGSSISDTYTLRRTCTAALIASGCTPATASRTIAAGQSDTASIAYVSTAAAGTTGQLKLAVLLASDTTVRDSSTIDVHVIPLNTPGVVVANLNPGESVERGLCLTISVHSGAYECGDLRLDYEFPGVRTMEKDRAPTLIYNNQFAHPIERVAAEITLPNDGRTPDSVTAKLLVTRAGSPVQVDAEKWVGTDWTVGSVRRVVLSYDASTDSTGLYQYSIQVSKYYGLTIESNTVSSDLVVVNRSTSPFGAGWWLAGLERIIPLTGSKWLWIGGDGSTRVFSPSGTNLWLAANVDRRERLEWDGTYYCRRLLHHACVLFNTQGQHVQTRNRLGEVLATLDRTNFTYAGTLLTSIGLPVPSGTLSYAFAYDTVSGKPRLLRVTAPPMGAVTRVTTATITSGQLLSLTYKAHPAISFAYDGTLSNRILSVTNQKGYLEKYTFGALNTLASAKLGLSAAATDTIAYTFAPLEIKGIGGAGQHAVPHQSAYTKYDGPRTDVGDSTLFWLDRFGEPNKIRDAIGNETVLTRADPTYPALVTQMRLANGRTSTATYDSVGHVLTSTAVNPLGTGVNATTTYTWNMKFDFVATTTSPTGLLNTFGYDTLTGNRLWQYPGTDVVRKVLFNYQNPLLQLSSTRLPSSPPATDSVLYGALGNVVATRSPKGFVDSLYENGIGMDTLTVSPIGKLVTDTARVRSRTVYDDRGLDTLSVANGSGIEWRTVRTHHDENGNADSVTTLMNPDRNAIGATWHAFAFDHADRRISDASLMGIPRTWVYDLAGNALNGGARAGSGVLNVYNALNQLVQRKSSDTATFVYDEVGQLTNANNATAQVARSYYLGGGLRTDSLRIGTTNRPDLDFTQHVYGLTYGYDLEGRRLWMKHPFAPAVRMFNADSTSYGYESVAGQLALVRDPVGNRFTYAYDTVGRLTKQVARAGLADSTIALTTYDLESNRLTFNGDVATYDARGKIYRDSTVYSPLGTLSYADNGSVAESYLSDALGNNARVDVSGPDLPATQPKFSHYWPGTMQLDKEWRRNGAHTDTTYHVYDGFYGRLLKTDVLTNADTIFTDSLAAHRYLHHTTNNHYDGQGQLDSTQTLVDTIPFSGGHLATDYMAIEMYRYDALNRRVWMRNIRGANCLKQDKTSGCRSNLRRTIWDGDQVLYEIQTKGDSGWTGLEQDNNVSAPYYGTIAYTHGIGIDAPLALYKDVSTTMVTPRQDLAGKFVSGDCHPSLCLSMQIYWPEAEGSQFSILGTRSGGPPSWYGSIIEGGQDASGYQYKRNRYYDPQTGKFTQEDPIGLAGGLNSYGFAGGDPVNYSDPFGLCFDPVSCTVAVAASASGLATASTGLVTISAHVATAAVIGSAEIAVSAAKAGIYSVYESATAGKGYIGSTNNMARRNSEHLRGPKQMSIRELFSGLSKDEKAGVEQVLIEERGLQKDGGTLLNQINAIAKGTDRYNRLKALGEKVIQASSSSPEQD